MTKEKEEKDHRRQYKGPGLGTKSEFECRGVLIHGPDRYYFYGACMEVLS
jgi:hypothetical protein